MPVISVILPIYNVERYITRCLESLLDQTFRDFEVILVDDASPDASMEMARKALANRQAMPEGGVRVLSHDRNRGLAGARNTGLEAARGTYVYFMDSDDYAEPTLLQRMMQAMTSGDADIVMCGSRSVYENDERPPVTDLPDAEGETTGEDALLFLLNGRCRAYICMQLFRLAIFREIRFPEGMIYEDRLTLPYLLLKARKVVFIREVLYNYLQREGSITRSFRPEIVKTMDSIRALKETMGDRLGAKDWQRAFFRYEYLNIQTIVFSAVIHSRSYGEVRKVLGEARKNVRFPELARGYAVMRMPVISLFLFKLSPELFRISFRNYLRKKSKAA